MMIVVSKALTVKVLCSFSKYKAIIKLDILFMKLPYYIDFNLEIHHTHKNPSHPTTELSITSKFAEFQFSGSNSGISTSVVSVAYERQSDELVNLNL